MVLKPTAMKRLSKVIGLPLEVIDGYANELMIKIPWSRLWKEPVEIIIEDIYAYCIVDPQYSQEFAEEMMNEHRTLQQSMFGLFLRTIEEWSKQKRYDLRNEYTVETSKKIMELLGGCSQTPFI